MDQRVPHPAEDPGVPELAEDPQVWDPAEDQLVPDPAEYFRVPNSAEDPRVPELVANPRVRDLEEDQRVPHPSEDHRVPEPVEDPRVPEPVEDPRVPEPVEYPREVNFPSVIGRIFITLYSPVVRGSLMESIFNLILLGPPDYQSQNLYDTLGVYVINSSGFPGDFPVGLNYNCHPVSMNEHNLHEFLCNEVVAHPYRFHPVLRILKLFTESVLGYAHQVSPELEYRDRIRALFQSRRLERNWFSYRAGLGFPPLMRYSIPLDFTQDEYFTDAATANLSRRARRARATYHYPRGGETILLNVKSLSVQYCNFLLSNQGVCDMFDLVEFLTSEIASTTTDLWPLPLPPNEETTFYSWIYSVMEALRDDRRTLVERLRNDIRSIGRDCQLIIHTNRYILAYVHSYSEWIREMYATYIFTGRDIEEDHPFKSTFLILKACLENALHNIECFQYFIILMITYERELREILMDVRRGSGQGGAIPGTRISPSWARRRI